MPKLTKVSKIPPTIEANLKIALEYLGKGVDALPRNSDVREELEHLYDDLDLILMRS